MSDLAEYLNLQAELLRLRNMGKDKTDPEYRLTREWFLEAEARLRSGGMEKVLKEVVELGVS